MEVTLYHSKKSAGDTDSVTVSQHAHVPETKVAKWNSAIIDHYPAETCHAPSV